jgi:Dolichyl-phosphate-mannose-protein mannosyltransferase
VTSPPGTAPSDALWRSWPIVAALLVLAAFYAVGDQMVGGFSLDLGSLGFPRDRYQAFLLVWFFFGAAAITLLALGLARWAAATRSAGPRLSDRVWVVAAAVLGLSIPLLIRAFLLEGAALTDDEAAYQFMAKLLASGRVRMVSHPMAEHFSAAFMVNDGHVLAMYPLGWPALLAVGELIGAPGLINPICSGLTAVAIFLIARRLTSPAGARVATVLYLTSPMAMACSATLLSNTSCVMALAWMIYFLLRCLDKDAGPRHHAAVAFFFGLAFFIRMQDGLGIGLPLLIGWIGVVITRRRQRTLHTLAAFALPAVVLGGLFLAANEVQNGSIWKVAYQHMLEYAKGVSPIVTGLSEKQVAQQLIGFDFENATLSLAVTGVGLLRMNVAAFGWPIALPLLFFAAPRRSVVTLLWSTMVSFLLVHFFSSDPGIDTFGPLHFYPLLLPMILLTVVGMERCALVLGRLDADAGLTAPGVRRRRFGAIPSAVVLSAVVVALLGYTPVRIGALGPLAHSASAPTRKVEELGLHNAVVFVSGPYSPAKYQMCPNILPRHFVFNRPINDPDLNSDVLWVNFVDEASNRRLLSRSLQGRRAYLMYWLVNKATKECVLKIVPYLNGPSTS